MSPLHDYQVGPTGHSIGAKGEPKAYYRNPITYEVPTKSRVMHWMGHKFVFCATPLMYTAEDYMESTIE